MNKLSKLLSGLFFVLILTGCIGENYNFYPPSVKLSGANNIGPAEMANANSDWRVKGNVQREIIAKDIFSLAKEQPQMTFVAGETVDLLFEHTDFSTKGVSVSVWKEGKKTDLKVKDISFTLPKDKGEYVIEVKLHTDRGYAQYVGNILVAGP